MVIITYGHTGKCVFCHDFMTLWGTITQEYLHVVPVMIYSLNPLFLSNIGLKPVFIDKGEEIEN